MDYMKNIKKPFLYALGAALYIVIIVFVMNAITSVVPGKTLIIPMVLLSLFVLSAAVMGFLFLSEPFRLYMENQKQEAISFFAKIVAIFACFAALFVVLFFLL
jgi:Ni/Fe-hydrogenase subunit HybB-like protein